MQLNFLRTFSILLGLGALIWSHPLIAGTPEAFLIGGGTRTEEIIQAFAKFAGGNQAKILIFPYATSSPKPAVALLREQFSTFEPAAVMEAPPFPEALMPDRKRLYACQRLFGSPKPIDFFTTEERVNLLSNLKTADVAYFTGGGQPRILEMFTQDPEFSHAFRDFLARGGKYAGTSAGTAAAPQWMMNGRLTKMPDGTVVAEIEPGLGILRPGIHIDQHFVQRTRYDRLKNLIRQYPEDIAIGISESTAVQFESDETFRVVGSSFTVVYFKDTPESEVREIWLRRGERFDLKTRRKITRLNQS
ncbi:MAG: Type 1 glutamine amidotransferase-like domain-containing protein [Cryobacterium sp.]|nr:Type 1 glutamine amidotransferase-like domain-containing protein [Oligoflexia bacterium]